MTDRQTYQQTNRPSDRQTDDDVNRLVNILVRYINMKTWTLSIYLCQADDYVNHPV